MKKLVLVFCLLFFSLINTYAQDIVLFSEEHKPFQYFDKGNKVAGFGVDLIKEIFDEAGISIKGDIIDIWPWSRAYHMALYNKNTAVFMTVRIPEREHLFKWVGPLASRSMWLFKLKKREDINLKNLEDVKSYKVAGYRNSADTAYMESLGIKVEVLSSQKLLIEMLLAERVDLVPSLELTMVASLQDKAMALDIVEKAILLDNKYSYFLALNRETDDSIVARLQTALDAIKQRGDYRRLREKYLK
mgnify:CR=1 FL=1